MGEDVTTPIVRALARLEEQVRSRMSADDEAIESLRREVAALRQEVAGLRIAVIHLRCSSVPLPRAVGPVVARAMLAVDAPVD